MGRSFRDALADDVRRVLLNTSEFAVDILYERSAQQLELAAIPDEPLTLVTDEFGKTSGEQRDFLIDPDALDFGGGPVSPVRGDVIHDSGRSFTVLPLTGTDCWDWDDEFRSLLRVHTKLTRDVR